jgi:hypothetical protein
MFLECCADEIIDDEDFDGSRMDLSTSNRDGKVNAERGSAAMAATWRTRAAVLIWFRSAGGNRCGSLD